MKRRDFLSRLMALGSGIVVVGPSLLADVHRNLPIGGPAWRDGGPWGRVVSIDRGSGIITIELVRGP